MPGCCPVVKCGAEMVVSPDSLGFDNLNVPSREF